MSTALFAAIAIVCQLPGSVSFYLIPLSLLAFVVAAVTILAMAINRFVKRCPRRAGSILLVFFLPFVLHSPIIWAAEVVHLVLTVRFNVGFLGVASNPADDSFAVYDWSVGLIGANTFLIHDVTDEIALPVAQHKHPLSSELGFGDGCAGQVDRLIGHYYLCYI